MPKTVKAAIIGTGTWGQVMIAAWRDNPLVEVVAVCDINAEQARKVAEENGIRGVYDDVDALLESEEIDAVGVATPDFAHRDPVIKALQSGKHVLVQKPMATTVADCQAMVKAQEESGRYLMVDFQHRWGIGMREAHLAVQSPSFGRPVHGRIRMSNSQKLPLEGLRWSANSNVLWFIGTHTLDLLRFVMQSEPVQVFAASESNVLSSKGVTTPDFFQTMIQFENGVWVQMENSWVMPYGEVDLIDLSMDIFGADEAVRVQQSPSNLIVKSTKTGVEVPNGARASALGRNLSINYFIDCVATSTPPQITAHDGLMNTATLVAIEKSVAEGRPVTLSEVLSESLVGDVSR